PERDAARGLAWLPGELPAGVRLVVSTTRAAGPFEALNARFAPEAMLALDRMEETEGGALLDAWLHDAGRALRDDQRQYVLERFELEGLPLYLKLAFEEARTWRSDTPPAQTRLSIGIPGVIRGNLLARLAAQQQHGPLLVARSLSYLA